MYRLILALLLAVFIGFSEDIEREIIRLIEEVKKAPPEERYKVMNELKLRLRELSEREREHAIRRVYEELKGREREEKHEIVEPEEREHIEEREEMVERYEEREEERMEAVEEKYEQLEERFEERYEEMREERERITEDIEDVEEREIEEIREIEGSRPQRENPAEGEEERYMDTEVSHEEEVEDR